MNENLIISFAPETTVSTSIGTGRGSKWASLEQDYESELEKEATIADVQQMLNLAKNGISPYTYVSDSCPYITIIGTTVIIRLDFYVWVSSLSLPYDLSTDLGTISSRSVHTEQVEFDLIFNGSDYEEMDYLFTGTFTPSMPIIALDGSKIPTMVQIPEGVDWPHPHMTVSDSSVALSEKVYTVFRAKGMKQGYKHTITMRLEKEDGYSIDNLTNSITLTWVDDDGEEQMDVLNLKIPECVEDLLVTCPGDKLNSDELDTLKYALIIDSSNSNKLYKVYVNTCDGSIITKRWEEKPGFTK